MKGLIFAVICIVIATILAFVDVKPLPVETHINRSTNDLSVHIFEGHEYINYFGGTIIHSESCPCHNRTIHISPADLTATFTDSTITWSPTTNKTNNIK